MILVRSALFNIAFYLWTAGMSILWLPALLGPRQWSVRGQAIWARGVMGLMRVLAGIRIEIRGTKNLPDGPALIASKHQSAWDTIVYHMALDDPAVVMKRELFLIPVYGWYASKVRMIPIDRRGGPKAVRAMIRASRQAAKAGRPIVIFPEGTRVAPGLRAPYRPGIGGLYTQLGVPVVPVALNSGLFWPRRKFSRRPGTIILEFLPPIPPGFKRAELITALEERLEPATDALIAEAQRGVLTLGQARIR
jgi:1-acyl-sn-glycerol-3-phosphate acyltransferase